MMVYVYILWHFKLVLVNPETQNGLIDRCRSIPVVIRKKPNQTTDISFYKWLGGDTRVSSIVNYSVL